MSWLGAQYAEHVLISYGSTALILGVLIWGTVSANSRARRELDQVDRERKQ